ncbi:MAG: transglutaminase family protein, partial [Bacteroidia bacterium]
MPIEKKHSLKKTLFQVCLLVVPTIVFICFILWRVNNFYAILENEWLTQTIYFSVGCVAALVLFSFRFRFITITLIVFLANYFIYQLLQNISTGEFDSFYISVKFYIFTILFIMGWLVGYAFSRSKYLTITWSSILLIIEIILISKTADITVSSLLNGLIPVLIYSFYIIYTAELIRNLNEDEAKFGWFVSKRLASFALLVLLLVIAILTFYKNDFKAVEKEWGGGKAKKQEGNGDKNSESMTKKDGNGGVSNKDQSQLSGSLSKDKQLIFVAKLDNFFENTDIPNPLYFTSHYYSKFDTATQTFEIDEKMPYNDLFKVDPSKIPLYFKKSDPSIIQKSLATLNRKIVSAEVYNVNLSATSYLAPSTAFYCQPVSIPKEFKQQYKSAYSAKMWVSELNSAYFIYNPAGNVPLEKFQEMRFEKLREVDKIVCPDDVFKKYFTYMPNDEEYAKIGSLAKKITTGKNAPIDKIIAIRDYFMSKDEFNQPLFKYSDNPGIPGLPSANKLTYFLLENRKGYCAYFAGATLFMLRSLGIPSRVAVGYLTVNRSSKNPGWYWFYEDQAHAWVQVYFQGYGWIDFDTTIPDVNTQQASQPDGTPPTDVPATYLVVDGEVVSTDTIKKTVRINSEKILYHDSEFVSKVKINVLTDVSIATISNDTGEVKLKDLKKGTHVTAVSHAEALKNIFTKPDDKMPSILERLPKPVPIDEIKIIAKEDQKKKASDENKKAKEPINWLTVLYTILWVVVGTVVVLFMSPWLVWMWLHAKAKKTQADVQVKAYNAYRASMYYLNQVGYLYYNTNPKDYATKIDKELGTSFTVFSGVYQKIKYSKTPLTESELKTVNEFYVPFIKQVKQHFSFKMKLKYFLN